MPKEKNKTKQVTYIVIPSIQHSGKSKTESEYITGFQGLGVEGDLDYKGTAWMNYFRR